MGFIESIISKTSTGKFSAAKNALVAKHAFQQLDNITKKKVNNTILRMLIQGGFPIAMAIDKLNCMPETEYFSMAAIALESFGIKPLLINICFRNSWHVMNNPLTDLEGAENQIKMASDEIYRKHGVSITVSKSINYKFDSNKFVLQTFFCDKCGSMERTDIASAPEYVLCKYCKEPIHLSSKVPEYNTT